MPWAIPIAAAVVGGVINKTTADKNAKAVQNAANTQAAADQAAIDEQRRQFDITQGNLAPWLDAGKAALGGQLDLLGLNGGDKQQAGIDALKGGPLYQSLYRNGVDTINANASATGGLRGGNIQRSLANFGSDTLASVIQQQLANLGGISNTGNATATNEGQLGANAATVIGNLTVNKGQDQAGGILGSSLLRNNSTSQLLQTLLSAAGAAYGHFGGGASSSGGANPADLADVAGLF